VESVHPSNLPTLHGNLAHSVILLGLWVVTKLGAETQRQCMLKLIVRITPIFESKVLLNSLHSCQDRDWPKTLKEDVTDSGEPRTQCNVALEMPI
jgi:hypothetical protein